MLGGALVEEKKSLGRLSVPVKIVLSVVQEHEAVICSVKEATSIVGTIQL